VGRRLDSHRPPEAAGKALLVLALVGGIAVGVGAGVVRQVFAVTLCHDATGLELAA